MRFRWLLPVFALGAVLRGALAWITPVINTDAVNFLWIAEGFLRGDFLAATKQGFHPLYPLLIAAGGGSDVAGIAVSILLGVAAGWPLYLLVRELGGERPAVVALVLYELHPVLIDIQSDIFADGPFVLLGMTAFYGAIRYAVAERGIWIAAIGASLACLTKTEGLIVGLICGIVIGGAILARRRPGMFTWRRLGFAAAAGLVIILPLGLYMKATSGHFKLTPKASGHRVLTGGGEDQHGEGKWLSRREKHGPLVGSLWYLVVASARSMRAVHGTFLLLALVTVKWWGPRLKGKAWILACIVVYLGCVWWPCYSIAHQISNRYLLLPLTLSIIFAAAMLDWVLESLRARRPDLAKGLVAVTAVAVLLSGVRDLWWGRRAEQGAWREAGEWVLKTAGPGKVIASTSDKPAYYARGRAVQAAEIFSEESRSDFFICLAEEAEGNPDIAGVLWGRRYTRLRTFPETPRRGLVTVTVWTRKP